MTTTPLRILLVEDNPADAALVRAELKRWGGGLHHITHVARLAEAVPLLMRGHTDVVLLDLTLPDSNGITTVERIHVMARHVPIVVLTGFSNDDVGVACIEAGASDYLAKDELDAHSIQRAVCYVLERRRRDELDALRETMQRYEALLDAGAHKAVEGLAALRERNPAVIEVLDHHHRALLEAYMSHLDTGDPKPAELITEQATQLGELAATPRDLIDVHVRAVQAHLTDVQGRRRRSAATAARQLAVEVMAALLEYYREGKRRPSQLPPEPTT